MPLSLLPSDSPLIQTIELSEYHLIHQHNTNWIYPPFQSFVGIRVDDEDNEPVGLISVMDDKPMDTHKIDFVKSILNAVKTRVKNETERTKQRDQLIAVKNAALRDAQSKIKFLADMSHEIRTPMNAVIALTDLLLQEKSLLNEEQIEHLEVIQTSGNHLLTVINDILDISKINHDPKFKLENRRFSLRKCVKDALNMARHQASMTQHNKLVYVVECPPDIDDNVPLHQLIHQLEKLDPMIVPQKYTKKTVLPLLWKIDAHVPDYVMGDSMRLTQILLNLCSNAVKFTKSGGIRVKVALSSSQEQVYQRFKDRYDAKLETTSSKKKHVNETSAGAYNNNNNTINSNMHSEEEEEEEEEQEKVMLEISVTDTGIGMPADRLPRLFKSFSQIDISTARRYGGTGLGLAISSMLVNRMDGGLWVESEEGIGSRFALTVPLIAATTQKRPSSITTRRSESSGTYNSGSMIASPPSPGSSLSDGGSSVGERSHHASLETTSPSTSIGYFPLQTNNSNKRPSWDTTHIPNDPSTCHSQNLQDILTKSQETKSPPKEAKKPPRISLAKHHRKLSHSHEENFALNYPTKILLAEDNVLNQKIAISILKRLGYQDVMIASNGREVLELMREHVFDVIFLKDQNLDGSLYA
ncbi:uncharacterized protein B0P05DRAFT_570424 [Gilbertella persicaria]|uniref:uncharacterized protein n=1 Tax=Gilbertella persicaria TaxID=101096 RepID=UPI00221F541E|nr:uncharacterized protein B0P05DRAFT_570424 [Gilbertella persicaria]KAI8084010.1 hypothetical protein B0P05DRAFT_570424 [Gilbertella persicaria]